MPAILDRRLFCAALAAAAVLPAAVARAAPRVISGRVFYRERIALPADAVLAVRLGVVEGNALGGHLIAEQIVAPAGQVPIAFSVQFDTEAVPEGATLGLDATISSAEATLFRTAEAVVLPQAGGEPLDIMLVSAARDLAQPAPAIAGVEWSVEAIAGIDDLGGAAPTLFIGTDGSAGGHGGCNRFFARASLDGESLAFAEIGSTFMACAPEVMRVEQAYFAALAAVSAWRIDEGGLLLLDDAGEELARLVSSA